MYSNEDDKNITGEERINLNEIYHQVEEIRATSFGRVRQFILRDLRDISWNWRSKR